MTMRVGVHCSVRNGFASAAEEAYRLGCETFQMFTQNPRGWKTRTYTEEEFVAFRAKRKATGLDPVVVHSPYLPNLCTSKPALFKRSLQTLIDDLNRSELLGADYLVIHPGAFSSDSSFEEGVKQLHHALNEALVRVPGRVTILVENMAGGGRRIGGRFSELAAILAGVQDNSRIGVCFDTCHATGAGYNLSQAAHVHRVLEEFDREVGLGKIKVFHVNDSKGSVGSHRDLHEHIGAGHVGLEGFRALFQTPVFRGCALILETPKDSLRADLKNLKKLRSCLPKD